MSGIGEIRIDVESMLKRSKKNVFSREKIKALSQVTSGIQVPSVLNDTAFVEESVSQPSPSVNPNSQKQDKVTSFSNREILVDALTTAVKSVAEYDLLDNYASKVKMLDEAEARISEIEAKFTKMKHLPR